MSLAPFPFTLFAPPAEEPPPGPTLDPRLRFRFLARPEYFTTAGGGTLLSAWTDQVNGWQATATSGQEPAIASGAARNGGQGVRWSGAQRLTLLRSVTGAVAGPFTGAVWVRRSAAGDYQPAYSKAQTISRLELDLYTTGGSGDARPVTYVQDAEIELVGDAGNPSPPLNTWYHYALSWDGTTYRMWLDAVEVDSQNGTLRTDSGADWEFGADILDQFFTGDLDVIEFYDAALPQADLEALVALAGAE